MTDPPIWPDVPFTRGDLDDLELSESDLRRGVRRGEIRPSPRGVYVASHLADTIELRAQALAKLLRPHQVVTDRTAAWLHGVDAHVYAEHDGPVRLETCALRWHARRS